MYLPSVYTQILWALSVYVVSMNIKAASLHFYIVMIPGSLYRNILCRLRKSVYCVYMYCVGECLPHYELSMRTVCVACAYVSPLASGSDSEEDDGWVDVSHSSDEDETGEGIFDTDGVGGGERAGELCYRTL